MYFENQFLYTERTYGFSVMLSSLLKDKTWFETELFEAVHEGLSGRSEYTGSIYLARSYSMSKYGTDSDKFVSGFNVLILLSKDAFELTRWFWANFS